MHIDSAKAAALRKIYPDTSNRADRNFRDDIRDAEAYLAEQDARSRRRQATQADLDALCAGLEKSRLAPLRAAAEAALTAHVQASAELEQARLECETLEQPLRRQIEELTREMLLPMFPTQGPWTAAEAVQGNSLEVVLAATTPMRAGAIPFGATA